MAKFLNHLNIRKYFDNVRFGVGLERPLLDLIIILRN